MLWYKHLYMGEKAKKHRFHILQHIRKNKWIPGIYVITPATNGDNLFDIYPMLTWIQEYYQKSSMMIVGVADGYQEALELAGRIVDEMYQKTGEFNVTRFLEEK